MHPGKVLTIFNPVSGKGAAKGLLQPALGALASFAALEERVRWKDSGFFPVVRTCADGTWKEEALAWLHEDSIQTLVVIGGDGTFMEAASLLQELEPGRRPPLLLVPAGRGNDFARSLHGYSSADGSFFRWLRSRPGWRVARGDLGKVNGRHFLNMASIGYGGHVARNAQTRNAPWCKTPLAYQVEGALAMAAGAEEGCEIDVDGQAVFSGPFFAAFVGNGRANAGGILWAPQASLADGRLDGIVFRRPGFWEMLRALPGLRAGRDPGFEHRRLKASSIRMRFGRPVPFELDGDFAGFESELRFECVQGAVSFWMPADREVPVPVSVKDAGLDRSGQFLDGALHVE